MVKIAHNKSVFISALSTLLLGILLALPAYSQSTGWNDLSATERLSEYRTQFEIVMLDLQDIAAAIGDQQMLDDAKMGQFSIRNITEEQWQDYMAENADQIGALPNLAPLSLATSKVVSRVRAFHQEVIPQQSLTDFPELPRSYPNCPPFLSDPDFISGVNTAKTVINIIYKVLQYVCENCIPIPIIGGCINFQFACIPASIALSITERLQEFLDTCEIIDDRPEAEADYEAIIFNNNLIDSNSDNLLDELGKNADENETDITTARDEITDFENDLKDKMVSHISATIEIHEHKLISDFNTDLAETENTIISVTTQQLTRAKNEILQLTNQKKQAILDNTNALSSRILEKNESDTSDIIENIETDSVAIMGLVTQLLCEDIRLNISDDSNSNLPVCSADTTSTPSQPPSNSSETPPAEVDPILTPATSSSGCSSVHFENYSPDILFVFASLFFLCALRSLRRRRLVANVARLFVPFAFALTLSQPGLAQTSPGDVATFRTQFEETMANLDTYFRATGDINSVERIQDGITAMATVTNPQLEEFFAEAPLNTRGVRVPDLSKLVELSTTLKQYDPTDQVNTLDLSLPDGFPDIAAAFCGIPIVSDIVYIAHIAKTSVDLILGIMHHICQISLPAVGEIFSSICIPIGALAGVLEKIDDALKICRDLEGDIPIHEGLEYTAENVDEEFVELQGRADFHTDEIEEDVNQAKDTVTANALANHTTIMTNFNTDVSEAQNTVIADVSTSVASLENSVISTTNDSINSLQHEVQENINKSADEILANANAQAAAIVAQAEQNAENIMANVRTKTEKILSIVRELGCQNISFTTGEPEDDANYLRVCSGQPGF